jgi:hypothetical protein
MFKKSTSPTPTPAHRWPARRRPPLPTPSPTTQPSATTAKEQGAPSPRHPRTAPLRPLVAAPSSSPRAAPWSPPRARRRAAGNGVGEESRPARKTTQRSRKETNCFFIFLFSFFFLIGLTSGPSVHVSKPIFSLPTQCLHPSDLVSVHSQFTISSNCK